MPKSNPLMLSLPRSFIRIITATCVLAINSVESLPRSPQNHDDLVRASRKAIIETGFSSNYFDQHFKLEQYVNKPGDLRIVWQFTQGEYRIRITDSLGYYTDPHGQKVYIHSIGNDLGATRNLGKTITKRRALARMNSCLGGRFRSDSVVLMKLDNDRVARLYLMAYSARGRSKEDPDRERQEKNRSRAADAQERPPVESDLERPITIGYINLETGRCSKGEASVTP